MTCDCCGNEYRAIYNVPNEIWTRIAPNPETLGDYIEHQFGGLLCVECAVLRSKGIGIDLLFVGQPTDHDANEQHGAEGETDE